jgi:hypothetical protein
MLYMFYSMFPVDVHIVLYGVYTKTHYAGGKQHGRHIHTTNSDV